MNLVFIIIYSLWFISELLLNRLLRSKSTDRKNVDKNSLSFIWITIAISTFLAVFISGRYYLPVFQNPAFPYAGLAIIMSGVILRLVAIASLGRFFTVDVTIRQNHTLKKDGFYKYLRHPSYFASFLSFLGFGFSLNNWIALALTTIPILIAFIRRIKIEEKVLIEQFGSEYLEYKRATSAIIPFVY